MIGRFPLARLWAVLLLVLFLLAMPVSAFAYPTLDTSRDTSLELHYQKGDVVLDGVAVRVYRVAEVSAAVQFRLAGDFSNYEVSLSNVTSQEQWNALAQTLAGYAVADSLAPAFSGQTDANGNVSTGNLQTGLYLVVADSTRKGDTLYSFAPFLISLPNWSAGEEGNWDYNVTANSKAGEQVVAVGHYRVVKHWQDTGYTNQRPQNVTIEIWRDGQLYETQQLSAENNWTYSWETSDNLSAWSVVERDIAAPYRVTVTEINGETETVFTVTNTYPTTPGGSDDDGERPGTDSDTPDDSSDSENPGDTSDQPGDSNEIPNVPGIEIGEELPPLGNVELPTVEEPGITIDEEEPPRAGALPQTGLLWWPVPLMAGGGMVAFACGWELDRREKKDDDEAE